MKKIDKSFLKRLLNQKMTYAVTAGDIIIDVERLRIPMQRITDHLLKLMGVKDPGPNVIVIHRRREY